MPAGRVAKNASMQIDVFIENPAGSRTKHLHDERTLELRGATEVSRAYPWPYGFIPGTWAQDDCCVDCFVVTEQELARGDTIACEVVALLEQVEDGEVDHNVIAVPVDGTIDDLEAVRVRLTEFITHVFEHVPGKQIRVGALLDRTAALAHIREHTVG